MTQNMYGHVKSNQYSLAAIYFMRKIDLQEKARIQMIMGVLIQTL